MMSSDLREIAQKVADMEQHFERVSRNAYILCRTLGYAHVKGGSAFVGPPTIPGFINTAQAVAQLLESLRCPRASASTGATP